MGYCLLEAPGVTNNLQRERERWGSRANCRLDNFDFAQVRFPRVRDQHERLRQPRTQSSKRPQLATSLATLTALDASVPVAIDSTFLNSLRGVMSNAGERRH